MITKRFYIKTLYIAYLSIFFILISCKKQSSSTTTTSDKVSITEQLDYAKGFNIQYYDNYTQITVTNPWPNAQRSFTYILYPKAKAKPKLKLQKDIIYIPTPIEKTIITSTTDIPVLEYLKIEDRLIGFPNTAYISSEKVLSLVANGQIKDIGDDRNLNTEIVLDLVPELIIGFSTAGETKSFDIIQNAGIPVIYNGSWTELHPLGRVEWIKFIAAFFDKKEEASQIFTTIKQEYLKATALAKNAKSQPTLLSGNLFKDIWYVPGGNSYAATFYKDANTHYLWADNTDIGSLALSFEEVLDKAQNAQFWIDSGYFKTLNDMQQSNTKYELFDAYLNKNVYSPILKVGPSGGLLYYELGAMRPDLILKDIIKIVHPEVLPEYTSYFFKRLE